MPEEEEEDDDEEKEDDFEAPLQRTHTNLIKHTEIRVLGYGRPRPRETTRFKTRDSSGQDENYFPPSAVSL